jgi:hypothetical protein
MWLPPRFSTRILALKHGPKDAPFPPLLSRFSQGAEKAPQLNKGLFRRPVKIGRRGRCEHCAKRFLFGAGLASAPSPQPRSWHLRAFVAPRSSAVLATTAAVSSQDSETQRRLSLTAGSDDVNLCSKATFAQPGENRRSRLKKRFFKCPRIDDLRQVHITTPTETNHPRHAGATRGTKLVHRCTPVANATDVGQ